MTSLRLSGAAFHAITRKNKHNKKLRYQDDIISRGGTHWSEAQVDAKAGIKPSTSLRSVAAAQAQSFLRIGTRIMRSPQDAACPAGMA